MPVMLCRETNKLPDLYVRILLSGGPDEDQFTYARADYQERVTLPEKREAAAHMVTSGVSVPRACTLV